MNQTKYYLEEANIIKYETDGLIYRYDFQERRWIEDQDLFQIFLGRIEAQPISFLQAYNLIRFPRDIEASKL